MEQAEAVNAELQAARAEVQELKTLLEVVLVSPPALPLLLGTSPTLLLYL